MMMWSWSAMSNSLHRGPSSVFGTVSAATRPSNKAKEAQRGEHQAGSVIGHGAFYTIDHPRIVRDLPKARSGICPVSRIVEIP